MSGAGAFIRDWMTYEPEKIHTNAGKINSYAFVNRLTDDGRVVFARMINLGGNRILSSAADL